jgi:hypothetical protein
MFSSLDTPAAVSILSIFTIHRSVVAHVENGSYFSCELKSNFERDDVSCRHRL